MLNLDQIHKLAPQIRLVAQKHGITRVYVFGSVARGAANPQSDIDFLVEMQEGATFFEAAGFGYEMEKLLGLPVDIVPSSLLSSMKDQEFSNNIQREAVAI